MTDSSFIETTVKNFLITECTIHFAMSNETIIYDKSKTINIIKLYECYLEYYRYRYINHNDINISIFQGFLNRRMGGHMVISADGYINGISINSDNLDFENIVSDDNEEKEKKEKREKQKKREARPLRRCPI